MTEGQAKATFLTLIAVNIYMIESSDLFSKECLI